MKKLTIYIVAVTGLIGTPVFAAEMAVKAPPHGPAPVYNWAGWYAGLNLGGTWSDGDISALSNLQFCSQSQNCGGLALLNTRTFAFEVPTSPSQSDSKTESTLKFDDKYKAVQDVTKTALSFHLDSLSVITSYTTANTLAGMGPASETQQGETIAFDLTSFRRNAGEMQPSVIWAFLPSSVYVNTYVKQASSPTILEDLPDRTTGISAGATWTWNGGNAGLGYWNYDLNIDRLGNIYNSTAHGFDATVSGYAQALGFYAKLSYHQSGGVASTYQTEDLASAWRTIGRVYDAYLSVFYKPQHLPDIVVDGGFGHYEDNSFKYGFADNGNYWNAGFGLDFSKYMSNQAKTSLLTAKLMYRYTNQTYHSFNQIYHNFDFTTTSGDHLIAILLKVQLG